jgi:hypothetical protein
VHAVFIVLPHHAHMALARASEFGIDRHLSGRRDRLRPGNPP